MTRHEGVPGTLHPPPCLITAHTGHGAWLNRNMPAAGCVLTQHQGPSVMVAALTAGATPSFCVCALLCLPNPDDFDDLAVVPAVKLMEVVPAELPRPGEGGWTDMQLKAETDTARPLQADCWSFALPLL